MKFADREEEDDTYKEVYSPVTRACIIGLFFLMGIMNHLGNILVLTGGRILAVELGMEEYVVTIYTSMSTVVALLTRILNAGVCIKIKYHTRMIFLCFWIMSGFILMFLILFLHKNVLRNYNVTCFILSFIPTFILGSAYSLGETAMLAYLRVYPKTFIAGWSSGTGLSGLLSATLNFISQVATRLDYMYLYLFLTPLGPLYLLVFYVSYRIYEKHKDKIDAEETRPLIPKSEESYNNERKEIQKEENEKEDEKSGENIEAENDDKNVPVVPTKDDNINKNNEKLSAKTFCEVIHMCGTVIINLGCIYMIQFFTQNAMFIINCRKIDITFLPCGCLYTTKQRRGKYEFVNLFFQVGMFLAKTFIRIVRRLKPIYIITTVMVCMCSLTIINYYTNYAPWWLYPIGLFIIGCFAGAAYSSGFYTILNSTDVPKNYKELAVTTATFFNDCGTFTSGVLGYILLKWVFSDVSPFPGSELTATNCVANCPAA